MATYPELGWKILLTEEPGGLEETMGSQTDMTETTNTNGNPEPAVINNS